MAEPGDQAPSAPGTAPRRGKSASFWREGHAALRLVFRSSLVLLIVCVLSFVASLQILLGSQGFRSLHFLSARHAGLWHTLLAFQPTLWLAALLSVFGASKRNGPVWPAARRERMALVFCATFVFAISMLPAVSQFLVRPSWLPGNEDELLKVPHLWEKLLVFNCIGSGVGALLGGAQLSVHVQLAGRPPRPLSEAAETAAESLEGEVRRYQQLRAQLKRCLGFAGAIISATLLTIGALRNLLIEAIPTQPDVLPATAVMGFGLYFTGCLAIIYLPASKALSEAGESLAARLVPPAPEAHTGWKQWSEEHQAVRTYLGLEGSALHELQQGLTLLSPFIASLSTLLLGTGR
ncbi:hypothetical protein NR798_46570 [Archangium gephyra]|uniref:hypothetical protein n=1 Tax=Archangium gephyra TaxID=48 RepID=UPI0035D45AA7